MAVFSLKTTTVLVFLAVLLHLSIASGHPLSDALHDALPEYGLPKGLVPDAVDSYTLADDGTFEIRLKKTCYVQFSRLVYYDKIIRGKLSYGQISNLSGIEAKKLFIWVNVSAMKMSDGGKEIEFFVGVLSEVLDAEQFEEIRACKSKGCRKEAALLAQE